MPQLKSSRKRLRQMQKIRARNRSVRTLVRGTLKRVRNAPTKSEAEALLPQAQSAVDRSVKKGVVHKKVAARCKSRLTRFVRAMEA